MAARRLFAHHSYDEVSLRQIGSEARTDPALVARYFGGKEQLFGEVLATSVDLDGPLLPRDATAFSRRMGRAVILGKWREAGLEGLLIALRSASVPAVADTLIDPLRRRFVTEVAASLDGEGAPARAELILALIVGTAVLYGLKTEDKAAFPVDQIEAVSARFSEVLLAMMQWRESQILLAKFEATTR